MLRRLALAALLGALAVAAPAHATEPFTKKALAVDVLTGPDGRTPCRVVADLYTPAGVSRSNPAPAIMATNGFGGSKNDFGRLGAAFARRGYVFLAYSGLGFGGSGCKITLDDRDWDGKAGSQLISFLGGSKAAVDGTTIDYVVRDPRDHAGQARPDDPRVGMIGGSYGGQIQFAIAGIDARLDTIVPQITWNDLAYSLAGNNTDFTSGVSASPATAGVSKLDWPPLFFAVGQIRGLEALAEDRSHLGVCPNFADQACSALVSTAVRGYPDAEVTAFLRHASVASFMRDIRIPTFIAQGQHDTLFNLQEAVATWKALRAQDTPVKMLWRSSGHSGGGIPGEWNQTDLEKSYESRMALEWFDWYLRGVGDPPALDFSFLRSWARQGDGDAAGAVGSLRSYPGGADRRLLLSGTGSLTSEASALQAGGATLAVSPVPTGAGGGALVDLGTFDLPGTFTAYTTPALQRDTDVVGVPTLTLRLDAPVWAAAQSADPATKLVLHARVEDVKPDGSASVPQNIVNAIRVADVTKPVRVELPGIVHRFEKGNRLRVVISQANLLRRNNNLAGPVAIRTSPDAPSSLTLPVLGDAAGPRGSGPSGTTPFQPVPGSPESQKAGLGGPPAGTPAASLPRRCRSRRNFRITLRRPPRGDRVRSAAVTVNGKRVKVVRGRRLRARIDLRGLPKGVFRVTVTIRTVRGRTLRSARTYRTCAARRR